MWKMACMIFLLGTTNALAHEGHDHGPGAHSPPKGGILRSLETVHLELKAEGAKVSIYPYELDTASKKLKPSDIKKYPVSATVTFPKKKQPETVQLSESGDHWEAEVDAKGAHRYTFVLAIRQGGHDDKVKFTVEPKRK